MDVWAAQMQSPIMRLPAGQSLQTLSEMVLEHMVRLNDMVMQTKAWQVWKTESRQRQEKHGMANADQVRCSTTGRHMKLAGLGVVS